VFLQALVLVHNSVLAQASVFVQASVYETENR